MPKQNKKVTKNPVLSVDDIRHSEYYDMQNIFDDLYRRSSENEKFTDLVTLILREENILLAYRNIKTNKGSNTPGIDGLTIKDIATLPKEEFVRTVKRIIYGGYNPKSVKRVEIPKDDGKVRPLGIPCIWDRIIQQCIKQVMEPICEAKFSVNSFGFRPERSVEQAIAKTYMRMQQSSMHYVVEFDIKGFFDEVNHSKLKKQIWTLGIHDKHLIYLISQMLKTPIRLPDGNEVKPTKGTPQGGILSPLLANIVLNEFDHWIESQWENNPLTAKYVNGIKKNGAVDKTNSYRAMRKTKLKEMYIVRYADDFRIFCKTKDHANRILIAASQWLEERLKLEVSPEKTKVINARKRNMHFLGFKIRLWNKRGKYVITSHICEKALKKLEKDLIEQITNIQYPRGRRTEQREIELYNTMVRGKHNYYRIATEICRDMRNIHRKVMTRFTNRLLRGKDSRLCKKGRPLTSVEKAGYGKSKMLRFGANSREPIYPIGYVQHKNPINIRRGVCRYTSKGRELIHTNLRINNLHVLGQMRNDNSYGYNTEYMDNRLSLFSGQYGKCAITGKEFECSSEIHCHHKTPKEKGGTDNYKNLMLILDTVHKLIHAVEHKIINKLMVGLKLSKGQISKLNDLRILAGNNTL